MSDRLDGRLRALGRAAELAEGRLEPAWVASARTVVQRAGQRIGLGVETTVVALAGPTGAGKSTLFNALAGAELARTSVRRPTTGTTAAATWGPVSGELLDWLDARTRHVVERDGQPVVVLDLPDFDSVQGAHRLEMERVSALADLLVWVVDPQKYADAALHDRYLKPLAGHSGVMAVVLNQADRLDPRSREVAVGDLRRLLAVDGIDGAPVLPVSATTGDGLQDLQALLADRAARRRTAVARLEADVAAAARGIDAGCSGGARRGGADGIAPADRARLVQALGDAAGVASITAAVARSHRRDGSLAAGWPPARWVRRLRPDPLKRLRLGDEDRRTSLPRATPVQEAQAATATRALAAGASEGLPDPWPGLVRRAATRHEAALPERLDRAVAGAQLPSGRPRWWALAGLLQRGLALVALAGLLWLAVIAALGFIALEDAIPLPELEGFPVPTLLLAGGLALGLLLALVFRRLIAAGARRRARRARRALDERVAAVADEAVIAPVRDELAARAELCAALADAAAA